MRRRPFRERPRFSRGRRPFLPHPDGADAGIDTAISRRRTCFICRELFDDDYLVPYPAQGGLYSDDVCQACADDVMDRAFQCPECGTYFHNDTNLVAGEWRSCDHCRRHGCSSCIRLNGNPLTGSWDGSEGDVVCDDCYGEIEERYEYQHQQEYPE